MRADGEEIRHGIIPVGQGYEQLCMRNAGHAAIQAELASHPCFTACSGGTGMPEWRPTKMTGLGYVLVGAVGPMLQRRQRFPPPCLHE